MRLVDARQMQEMDARTIKGIGVPSLVLMENAARSVAEVIESSYPDFKTVFVFCGSGNNGGDGYALARILKNKGYNLYTVTIGHPRSEDCIHNANLWNSYGKALSWEDFLSFFSSQKENSIFVDAILGTGITRGVEGDLAEKFNWINQQERPLVAVDIASGINASSGDVSGAVLKSDKTVTFQVEKIGHYLHPGKEYSGNVICQKISIQEIWDKKDTEYYLVDQEKAGQLFPQRSHGTYKNQQGHLGILCGNEGTIGASLLSSKSGLKSGCGLVTLSLPEKLCNQVPFWYPEVMTYPREQISQEWFNRYDAYVIGSGLGRDADIWEALQEYLNSIEKPVVLDADAFHGILNWAFLRQGKFVLTPHMGEFLQMTGYKYPDTNAEKIELGISFAKKFKTVLLLKGAPGIVFSPDGRVFINETGNAGMATAGTGDVLGGIIGGLLAQGMSTLDSAILGNWLHGKAGDLAATAFGMAGLTASDLVDYLPPAAVILEKNI